MTIDTPAGPLTTGKRYTVTLRHGSSSRVVKQARVHSFEQRERVYDEEGIAVGVEVETRYELTGMHQNVAPGSDGKPGKPYQEKLTIGFRPEDVTEIA